MSWFILSGAAQRSIDAAQNYIITQSAAYGFTLQNILVEGRQYTDTKSLMAQINIKQGDPLLRFDPTAAQDKIENLSWVRTADIQRRFPNTIYIYITERTPMALWQKHKNDICLIDADGVVLTRENLAHFRDFIIISGKNAPEAAPALLSLLDLEPEIRQYVDAAQYISIRRWNLVLKSGAVVKLPANDIGGALRRIVKIQDKENILEKKVKIIDVRDPDRISVRTHPGDIQNYKAGVKL